MTFRTVHDHTASLNFIGWNLEIYDFITFRLEVKIRRNTFGLESGVLDLFRLNTDLIQL